MAALRHAATVGSGRDRRDRAAGRSLVAAMISAMRSIARSARSRSKGTRRCRASPESALTAVNRAGFGLIEIVLIERDLGRVFWIGLRQPVLRQRAPALRVNAFALPNRRQHQVHAGQRRRGDEIPSACPLRYSSAVNSSASGRREFEAARDQLCAHRRFDRMPAIKP